MTAANPAGMVLTGIALFCCAKASAEEVQISRYISETSDRLPEHTVAPQYPKNARRDRIEGDVRVCYNIDRKGNPIRVAVRTSTNRIFERPSLTAVKASSYRPLPDGAKDSGIKTCRTFRFRLEPVEEES